jgi:inner membrane protein
MLLALVTHPLLDAHTAYGTQLWWPLTPSPTAWSTVFIIDPLYTLPLIVGVAVAAARPGWSGARKYLAYGLVSSSAYLGWSWIGKLIVEHHASEALVAAGRSDARVFSTPAPFNTLLWRVVVLTEDGFLEGYDSLILDDEPMRFQHYPSDTAALAKAADLWAVRRLVWFASGFVKTTVLDERLILTDLRMGQEPKYVFSHVVAQRRQDRWLAVESELLPMSFDARDVQRSLGRIFGAKSR